MLQFVKKNKSLSSVEKAARLKDTLLSTYQYNHNTAIGFDADNNDLS